MALCLYFTRNHNSVLVDRKKLSKTAKNHFRMPPVEIFFLHPELPLFKTPPVSIYKYIWWPGICVYPAGQTTLMQAFCILFVFSKAQVVSPFTLSQPHVK